MRPRRCYFFLLTAALSIPRPTTSANSPFPKNTTLNPLLALRQFPLSFYSSLANTTSPNPAATMPRLAPVICISHGGGPMPVLGDPSHAAITKSLQTRVPKILKLGTEEQPRAIVLVTAHWSTNEVRISSAEKHDLYYDYGGFPDEAYSLRYDAKGSPEVAELIRVVLGEVGIKAQKDGSRGWDHGVFVPMMLINPAANIPIIQLSVLTSESPSQHYALGRALSKLRSQNIAIVGSGFASLHNTRAMFSGQTKTPAFKQLHEEWSESILDAIQTEDVEERGKKFEGWRGWKGAYEMHPRGGAEHFLPLIVCAGAGGGKGKGKAYSDEFMGLQMWSYYWEE